MLRANYPTFVLVLICGLFQIISSDELNKSELMKSPLNRTINEFGLRLLQQLTKSDENQCNIFVSPFSIMLVFSMLLHGTDGKTTQEILDTFGYRNQSNLNVDAIHQSFQDLLYEISKKQRNYTLNIGSMGLLREGLNPSRQFRTKLFEDYNAVIMNLNFKNQQQTEKTLNNWIRTITSNRVTALDNGLSAQTNFVLMNAIYFQGKWRYPFSTLNKQYTFYNQLDSDISKNGTPKSARKEDQLEDKLVELTDKEERKYFNISATDRDLSNENVLFKPSKVEMMGNLRPLNYIKADDGEFELFELPYEGDLSMFVILPHYTIKMQSTLSKLNSTYLSQLIDRMDKQKLRVMLPKFRIEQKLELKNSLRRLGLIDLFDENANLERMFANRSEASNLYVNQAIQNAFINVDHEGTVALGSTSLKSLVVSGFKEIVVQVNRPFIFFIKDTLRDVILFSGTLCRFI